jgi:hypothetical protein
MQSNLKNYASTLQGSVPPHTPSNPVTGHELDNRRIDGGKVVSLTRRQPFTPQKDSWYSFLLEAESTLGS